MPEHHHRLTPTCVGTPYLSKREWQPVLVPKPRLGPSAPNPKPGAPRIHLVRRQDDRWHTTGS